MTTAPISGETALGTLKHRLGAAAFGGGFLLAALLTVTATLFAVSGAGPLPPASPVMIYLLAASLAISAGLGIALAFRIIRVARERATPQSGARIHLRFVALFSAAAVVPAIMVALFLSVIMTRGIDEWFSNRVVTVMENAALVGRSYINSVQDNVRGEVLAMASDLNRAQRGLTAETAAYTSYLGAQAKQRDFVAAYVVSGDGRVLASSHATGAPDFQAPASSDFAAARAGELTILLFEDDALMRALYRLDAYGDAYLFVTRLVDPAMLRSLRSFDEALADYRETADSRAQIQAIFVLAYLATAVLITLGAIWLGLFNARRISAPIGRLAEAAGRVAGGDLDARVDVGIERDEVDALGRAFNRMTSQLDSQHRDLVSARLEAESRSLFIQTVLSNVSAGVIGLDRDGRVTAANSSAASLLRLSRKDLDGRRLVDVAPEFGDIVLAIDAAPAKPARIDVSRGGDTVHLSVRVSGAGGASGFVLTFDDMTKLVAAQRQEAWKDVARRIAHEIKNPLTPIQLSAERLQRRFSAEIQSDAETFKRCTETILRQVSDIGRMVDEFSSFARMPAPRIELIDIAELARECVFDQRISFSDITFECDGAESAIMVECDGRLIAQALGNVLKNAAEAIQGRRARDGEPKEGRVVLRLMPQEGAVAIEISDNGGGFPVKDRDKLIEPYVTTRAKGTGLGLAIVSRVIEDHGGALALGDAPTSGALVRMVLPVFQTSQFAGGRSAGLGD